MKRLLILAVIVLFELLTSCSGYPQLLSYPFDIGGRSLNSPASQLGPKIASRYIVFASDRRGSQDIYLFDMVNGRLVELPGLNQLNTIASEPAVSENGRYIVFTALQQARSAILLYDRETRQLRNLTADLPGAVRHPTISANGSKVAFESSANGQWDIVVYDLPRELRELREQGERRS